MNPTNFRYIPVAGSDAKADSQGERKKEPIVRFFNRWDFHIPNPLSVIHYSYQHIMY